MDTSSKSRWLLTFALCLGIGFTPSHASADDIDIFVGGTTGGSAANVLVIIDNTSNWADSAQKWPGGEVQGQAELEALIAVVPTLKDSVNVGLMLFNANGSGSCCSGGYIRFAMQPMTAANKTALLAELNNLLTNFTDPLNKAASNASYSMALFDAFKYFGGYTSPSHATDDVAGTPQNATHFGPAVFATPASTFNRPDPKGYTDSTYMVYNPPAAAAGVCGGKNYIIFIGNGFPNTDTPPSENMKTILEGVGGNSTQIWMPVLTTTTSTKTNLTVSPPVNLGYSSACYSNNGTGLSNCSTANASTCGSAWDTCACTTPTITTGCSGSNVKYSIQGRVTTTVVAPTGTIALPAANKTLYADEWTRFLYSTDVNVAIGKQNVTTFTIDAFNAKQDADQTALLYSMANFGAGKYYAAKNKNDLIFDLGDIFAKIQAVDSTFASASLPINAINRTVRDNQVFVGVFRPDPDLKPRWFGNLKQYQLVLDPINGVALADANKNLAVNPLTGFIDDCATSFWTTDSNTYWSSAPTNPSSESACKSSLFSAWSDTPDGPQVQKGAVAEVIRKGNNPPTTNTTPTWAVNRTMNTFYSGGLSALTTTTAPGLTSAVVNFTLGQDVNDENINGVTAETRPSLHGDVIHSRPLAIDYGGTPDATVVYYGANDGTLRAVDASSGKERWAFVANEFFATRSTSGGVSPLQRMKDNTPLVSYGTTPLADSTPRDYLFDGSIGVFQNADNSKVWIYPTMRRGGRMIYALEVKTPDSPVFKWKVGCTTNLGDDTGCPSGMIGIGQTWSTPNIALVKGYSTTTPIVAVGGGYDTCEDANTSTPPCSTPKGNHVYLMDANAGTVLRTFDTLRSVIADVAYVDVDFDGYPDYAYVVDTGGNIYRIDFVDSSKTPLAKDAWSIHIVAYTNYSNGYTYGATPDSGRKFQYAPAVLPNQGKVYLALGSGDREHPLQTQYPFTTPVTNRFYVYLDDLAVSPADKTLAVNLDNTSSFKDFTVNQTCGTANVLPNSSQKGWFMNLNQYGVGEQTVTSAAVVAGMVTFSTNRPVPQTVATCQTTLGEARGYFVNLFNGSGAIGVDSSCGGAQSSTFIGGGLPPSPVVATVVVDGQTKTVVIGGIQKGGGASSVIGAQSIIPPLNFKRKMVYWFNSGSDNK